MNGATNLYILINPKPHSEWNTENPKPYAKRVKTLSNKNAQNID